MKKYNYTCTILLIVGLLTLFSHKMTAQKVNPTISYVSNSGLTYSKKTSHSESDLITVVNTQNNCNNYCLPIDWSINDYYYYEYCELSLCIDCVDNCGVCATDGSPYLIKECWDDESGEFEEDGISFINQPITIGNNEYKITGFAIIDGEVFVSMTKNGYSYGPMTLVCGENPYQSSEFGLIYSNGDDWYYVYDKGIWIYIGDVQYFCSDSFWFYTSSNICGYTGWFFYTSGSDWVYNSQGVWLYWNNCFPPNNNLYNNENEVPQLNLTQKSFDKPSPDFIPDDKDIISLKQHNKLNPDESDWSNMVNISPNPFREVTNISYFLPKTSMVNITVYDGTGKQVALLENSAKKPEGRYEIQFDASNLSAGLYYIRIQSDEYSTSRKVVITQ